MYQDAPFADTYTIAFKKLTAKEEFNKSSDYFTDYAPVKGNRNFDLDSSEGFMAIGSVMYFYAHRPST